MQQRSQYRYALRKLSVGLTSVTLGLTITSLSATKAHADTVQQNENQTSQITDTTVVKQDNSNNLESENVKKQDINQAIPEGNTNVESKITTKAAEETKQELNDTQVKVDVQNDLKEKNLNQQEATTSDKEATGAHLAEENKNIDPALVNSATEHLSAVKYNVFDIREATEIWANDQLKNWYLGDSFKQVHDQLPSLTEQLLEHADNLDTAEKRVSDNAAAIMIGMSYINHLYNISYGDKELKPIMMFEPKALGSNLDSIDWLTNIGKLTYKELLPENNVTTFNQKLAPMLNTESNLITFLGDLRKKWTPDLTDEEWFRSNTGVHIVEIPSKEVPNLNLHLYHRLSTGGLGFQKYILPILNIKNDDMYIVSALGTTIFGLYDPYIDIKYHKDPVVYQEKVKQVHAKLAQLTVSWGNLFDFWYRMASQTGKDRLTKANIQVWDTYNAVDSSKKGGHSWLSKYDTTTPGMAEFFGSVGEKYDAAGISADATGTMVRYYVAKVIDDYGGIGVFTHEMTHNFDNSIYLDGFHRRPGLGPEMYADGLLQSPWKRDLGVYAINTARTFYADNRTTNKGPDRFQTREDLQEYMHGLFDVTYVLDYLEAQAMVNKSASEKQLMYSQISYDSAKKADVVSGPISAEVADKLKTIDDFIDNNIIASRGYKSGDYGSNGYQQISMYAPDYAGVQSATSASGAITFRKTAFELLAAKGWKDGFIAYTTDRYMNEAKKAGKPLSDAYVLEKVFNGEYNNDYATFKKAMFKERIDKRNNFKPITITLNQKQIQLKDWEDLQKLMQTSVDQELMARSKGKGSNAINNLKAAVLMAEMKQTNDFRNSIFSAAPANQGKILGDGTNYGLPAYDAESLKKGEAVEDGASYDLPEYDAESLKKSEPVEDGASYDLPEYDVDSLKKGEAVEDGASYDLPEYDAESLKKGEAVEDGANYDLPEYDAESLKKGETVEDGTSYDLPEYDAESLKKGEPVEDGASYDLPEYDAESLKKGEAVEDGTNYDLPEHDVDSLKKGEAVEDGTNYDLPEYDAESLKKGEPVEDGANYDLPEYNLDSSKKGESVEDSTNYDLPEYDVDLLKKGETIEDGTSYDLPEYDAESLKKGEPVEDGTNYDLLEYNLDSSKEGESIGDSTNYDLPEYDVDSLKKGEAGTNPDLSKNKMNSFKKGEFEKTYSKDTVSSSDTSVSQNSNLNSETQKIKNELLDNKNISQKIENTEPKLLKANAVVESQSQIINNTKKINDYLNSHADFVNHELSLENDQFNENKQKIDLPQNYKGTSRNLLRKDQAIVSKSRSSNQLPQTNSKRSNTGALILGAFSSVLGMLGLSNLRRKDK